MVEQKRLQKLEQILSAKPLNSKYLIASKIDEPYFIQFSWFSFQTNIQIIWISFDRRLVVVARYQLPATSAKITKSVFT